MTILADYINWPSKMSTLLSESFVILWTTSWNVHFVRIRYHPVLAPSSFQIINVSTSNHLYMSLFFFIKLISMVRTPVFTGILIVSMRI